MTNSLFAANDSNPDKQDFDGNELMAGQLATQAARRYLDLRGKTSARIAAKAISINGDGGDLIMIHSADGGSTWNETGPVLTVESNGDLISPGWQEIISSARDVVLVSFKHSVTSGSHVYYTAIDVIAQ